MIMKIKIKKRKKYEINNIQGDENDDKYTIIDASKARLDIRKALRQLDIQGEISCDMQRNKAAKKIIK